MRRLFIIGIVGLCVFLLAQWSGIFQDRTKVDYGSKTAEERAGIQRVQLHGIFNAKDYIEPGLPTIIEFYTDACAGCRVLHGHFKKFLRLRPDVAVRQIRLPNDWQPQRVWRDHNVKVGFTPFIIIYGSDGELIAQDEGRSSKGFDYLYKLRIPVIPAT